MHAPRRWTAALTAAVLFVPLTSAAADDAIQAKTLARLRRFVEVEKRFEDSPAQDRHAWFVCHRLSRATRDEELPGFEAFAVGPEAKSVRWLLAGILAQRNQFDAAAHVMTRALAEDPKDRQYRMWKWWHYSFRERADFDEMSLKIAEGFLRQFERGTVDERIAIAEIFGKDRAAADLSAAQFRKAIGLPEKK